MQLLRMRRVGRPPWASVPFSTTRSLCCKRLSSVVAILASLSCAGTFSEQPGGLIILHTERMSVIFRLGRFGRPGLNLSCTQVFHLPITEAADTLGMSISELKMHSQAHGIQAWPYTLRLAKELKRRMAETEAMKVKGTGNAQTAQKST